jgi:MATE family multidrug resistance protein
VAIALQLFVIAALFQLFDGVQVIAAGALRGYCDTAVPMLIAAIGYWAIGFVGGWLLDHTDRRHSARFSTDRVGLARRVHSTAR